METNYIVVFNDRKKGEASASLLCQEMNSGALIISAVATRDSVHYLIERVSEDPQMALDPAEERQIIRDNLDAEENAENPSE